MFHIVLSLLLCFDVSYHIISPFSSYPHVLQYHISRLKWTSSNHYFTSFHPHFPHFICLKCQQDYKPNKSTLYHFISPWIFDTLLSFHMFLIFLSGLKCQHNAWSAEWQECEAFPELLGRKVWDGTVEVRAHRALKIPGSDFLLGSALALSCQIRRKMTNS